MSHFAVLVISKTPEDVDDLLAPYDENIEVDPYIDYTHDDAIASRRALIAIHLDKIKSKMTSGERIEHESLEYWAEQNAMSDDECFEYMRDGRDIDEDGNILSTYNPNSKWDWYSIGGRFSCEYLRDKNDGNYVDELWAKDLSTDPDKEEYKNGLKWWEDWVEGKDKTLKDKAIFEASPDWYKAMYKDKETYARTISLPIFRAVVTPDGQWHEKGTMWWFAMSTETPEESVAWDASFMDRFIKPAIKNNNYLTVVDCHI